MNKRRARKFQAQIQDSLENRMLLTGWDGSITSAILAAPLGHHPVTQVKILTEPGIPRPKHTPPRLIKPS